MSKYKTIVELGTDLLKGKINKFSEKESNETLRLALLEVIDCKDGKFDYKKYRKNKNEVFEILEEIVDTRIEEGIYDRFDQFVEYRNVDFGDQLRFRKNADDLFEVSMIAPGTNNLRRQRLEGTEYFDVNTGWYGVKFYEELERFLEGRVDWVALINKIDRSFNEMIGKMIYDAVVDAYSGLGAPYYETGSWDLETFNTLVAHVEAATGRRPMVVGTRQAVQKVRPYGVETGGLSLEQRNADGFFRVIDGINFTVLPPVHKPGTTEFAYNDNFLLILPEGDEKILRLITEGYTMIKEVGTNASQENADDSMEYTVRKKFGLAALKSSIYGVYILS